MNLSEAQLLENRKKKQISNFNIYFSNIRFISKSNFNKGADSLLAYRSQSQSLDILLLKEGWHL